MRCLELGYRRVKTVLAFSQYHRRHVVQACLGGRVRCALKHVAQQSTQALGLSGPDYIWRLCGILARSKQKLRTRGIALEEG